MAKHQFVRGTASLPARDWLSACVDCAGCLQASRQAHANTFVTCSRFYYNSSGTLRKILEKGKEEREREGEKEEIKAEKNKVATVLRPGVSFGEFKKEGNSSLSMCVP